MKCNEFQKEFDGGNALGKAASLHLKSCPNCQRTEREQAHIRQIIGSFKQVEAPKNFNFRVQARIAEAKSSKYKQSSFLPAFRYALPIALFAVILAFIAVGSFNLFEHRNAAQIAENEPQIKQNATVNEDKPKSDIAENEQTPENTFDLAAENETAKAVPERTGQIAKTGIEKVIAKNPQEKNLQRKQVPTVSEDDFIGSRDSAVKGNSTVILPPNMTGDQTNKNPNDKTKIFTVQEVLSQIGIETAHETRIVKTVRENSLAERSGVKTGDIIEAIDGQILTEKTFGNKTVEGKTLTILRDGKKSEINLVSRQN